MDQEKQPNRLLPKENSQDIVAGVNDLANDCMDIVSDDNEPLCANDELNTVSRGKEKGKLQKEDSEEVARIRRFLKSKDRSKSEHDLRGDEFMDKRKDKKKKSINPKYAKVPRYVYTQDGLKVLRPGGGDAAAAGERTPLVGGGGGLVGVDGSLAGLTIVPDRPDPRTMFSKKLGDRIDMRKQLLQKRRWLVDLQMAMAMTGMVLMVLDNEFYFMDKQEKNSVISLLLKSFVSISTGVLLVAILLYYHTGAEIKMLDARVDDPLAVMSFSTWLLLAVELSLCVVHPPPGNLMVYMSDLDGRIERVMVDGILSVLMIFRLYLVGRFLVVHSPLLTEASTQTISAVSHVKISMFFVFKAAMADHPGAVIAASMVTMYGLSVWGMRTCELYYTTMDEAHSFSESMWLSAITFLTVGYGDLTPATHCGRFIAILTGMAGLATTALLVAVAARKLEQSRSERAVYNYLTMIHLEHRRKAVAADVIKAAIRVNNLKQRVHRRNSQMNQIALTYASWKLSNAVRVVRSTRVARQRVEEASVGLPELSQQVSATQTRQRQIQDTQSQILAALRDIQARLPPPRHPDHDHDD